MCMFMQLGPGLCGRSGPIETKAEPPVLRAKENLAVQGARAELAVTTVELME